MKYEKVDVNSHMIHTPSKVDFYMGGGNSHVYLDDEFKVELGARSPIANMYHLGMDEADLKAEILGGRYFIVNDKVVDHRLKSDLKFEHSTESVKALVDKLGFASRANQIDIIGGRQIQSSGPIVARATRESFQVNPLDIPGSQFDIHIGFNWSPFELDIHSVIEMWRLVCSNGAIAQSPILDNKIPMLNRWEENLAISDRVVRHNFDKLVLPRLAALPEERITLADVAALRGIINGMQQSKHLRGTSVMALSKMEEVVDGAWLSGSDKLKKNMLKFVQAPMTAYDAYNIVTEASTHHLGRDRTNHTAQAFVSSLIFNADRQRSSRTELDSLMTDTNTFANPDRAFFAETCH